MDKRSWKRCSPVILAHGLSTLNAPDDLVLRLCPWLHLQISACLQGASQQSFSCRSCGIQKRTCLLQLSATLLVTHASRVRQPVVLAPD